MTIEQIQELLAYLGYYDLRRKNGSIAIDGLSGPSMAQAVKDFQKDNGLDTDGEPGVATQAALRKAVGEDKRKVVNPVPSPAPAGSEDPGRESWWKEIKWFAPVEFACKCRHYGNSYCNGWPSRMCETTVRLADRGREHFGKPGHINSGLRCKTHNKNSGGVWNSLHLTGEACDIWFDGISGHEVLSFYKAQPEVVYAYIIKDKYGKLTNAVHYNIARGAK